MARRPCSASLARPHSTLSESCRAAQQQQEGGGAGLWLHQDTDRRLGFTSTQTSSWPLPTEVASVQKSTPEHQAGGGPVPPRCHCVQELVCPVHLTWRNSGSGRGLGTKKVERALEGLASIEQQRQSQTRGLRKEGR